MTAVTPDLAVPARGGGAGRGINRWIFRVLAYVALKRDEYPPFRLRP